MYIQRKAEIDFDSTIRINEEYIIKEFSRDILLFFYNMPNWVVFSKDEFATFQAFSNFTVREVIYSLSEKLVKETLRKLFSRKILGEQKEKVKHEISKILPMHIYLTNNCNLKCIHCYMKSGKPLRDELSIEDWRDILGGFIEYGGKELSISGGEPLSVNFFPDLISWSKMQKRTLHIKLLTNGIFLDKLPLNFLNTYINEIQISIDGPTPEINDRIRGQGHFTKVMDNLSKLRNFKGNITISMCVVNDFVKGFAKSFKGFYNNIVEIIPNIKFGIATDLMDGRNYKKLNYHKAKRNLETVSGIFNSVIKKFNMEGEEEKKFERNVKTISCGYGGTLTVTANGYIYPCGVIYEKSLGFFKETTISEFAAKSKTILSQFAVDSLHICNNCNLKYVCGGTCRIENHKATKDLTFPICSDEAKEDIYNSIYHEDLSFEM